MRKSRKLKKLQRAMDKSESYAQWCEAAIQHDETSGAKRWREVDQTSQYDYSQIRLRLDRLRSLRARHDHQGLLFTLNEGIHGNMGGMGRSSLYRRAKFGTKKLIEQYIDEVDDAMRYLAELQTPDITTQQKLDFFYRANICMGRSALMLSGGGVLGFYDGFFGPGTGAFWTIATVALLGLELRRATAYTKVVNLGSNLGSLIVFAFKGAVLLPAAAVMVGGQLIGTYLGSGLVLAKGATLIRRVFLCVVIGIVVRLLWMR